MSKKYMALIPMVLLLAACSPEAEEDTEELAEATTVEEVSEETAEINSWEIASTDEAWDGAVINIEEHILILERKLPESPLTVFTSYDLAGETDYLAAENIAKHEILVPHDEEGELLQEEADAFQNENFESEEVDEGTLFVTENPEAFEDYAYLAPSALHVYEDADGRIEVLIMDEAPAIVLGLSSDEDGEETEDLTALYHSLNQALQENSTPGIEDARLYLDEILVLTPESPIAALQSQLIDQAELYLQAFNDADPAAMETELVNLDVVPYSNLYGVYDTYRVLQEEVAPYMDIISGADRQLELASDYLDNGQLEDAERILVQLSGINEIINTYYPAKAEKIASIQTKFMEAQEAEQQETEGAQASQGQASFEDFLGYWGNVEAPYASISPGQEMLYISHNYYAAFVMNSDVGSSGQIQGSSLDGNTLYLDIFTKGMEPNLMYPEGSPDVSQTITLTMHEEGGSPFIVSGIDGFMTLYYPVDRDEALYLMGSDMEDNLNSVYQ